MKPQVSFLRKNRWLLLIILLGLTLRLIDIGQPYIGLSSWNEAHYSLAPLNYFKYGLWTPMNDYGLDLSTTPLLYWGYLLVVHALRRLRVGGKASKPYLRPHLAFLNISAGRANL